MFNDKNKTERSGEWDEAQAVHVAQIDFRAEAKIVERLLKFVYISMYVCIVIGLSTHLRAACLARRLTGWLAGWLAWCFSC